MKKILSVMLALLLTVGGMLALTACGGTEPEIPEGYQVYENNDISFAYPEGWSSNSGSVVTLVNPDGIGNNITVVYEAKTDMYDDMTVESFNSTMKPAFEAMGLSVSNVSIDNKKTNGLDVVQLSYTAKVSGQSMTQTAYITTIGESTYTVTVTEVTQDDELVETVFETLHAVK